MMPTWMLTTGSNSRFEAGRTVGEGPRPLLLRRAPFVESMQAGFSEALHQIRHGEREDLLLVGHRPRVVDGEHEVDLVDRALGESLDDGRRRARLQPVPRAGSSSRPIPSRPRSSSRVDAAITTKRRRRAARSFWVFIRIVPLRPGSMMRVALAIVPEVRQLLPKSPEELSALLEEMHDEDIADLLRCSGRGGRAASSRRSPPRKPRRSSSASTRTRRRRWSRSSASRASRRSSREMAADERTDLIEGLPETSATRSSRRWRRSIRRPRPRSRSSPSGRKTAPAA
jgi:hypothetical protein